MANSKESFETIYCRNGDGSAFVDGLLFQAIYLVQKQESSDRGDKHIVATLVTMLGDQIVALSDQYRASQENGVHKN